nr:uncharacterized protein LOC105334139 [Crassostrea gigas]
MFSDVKPIRFMEESQLCKLQFTALESLVRIVVGHDASVFTAVDYVNQTHQIPQETTLHPDTVACIRRLCDHQNWEEPSEGFTVAPVNSPAVLIHWRCLVVLMSALQPEQCEQFCVHGRVTGDSQSVSDVKGARIQVSTVDSSTEEELICINASYGSDVNSSTETVCDFVPYDRAASESIQHEAFDSHFHLDRTCNRIWRRSSGKSVEDVLRHTESGIGRSRLDVKVTGCVIVYSEPAFHPETVLVSPRGVAVGVHPKHFQDLTSRTLLHMKDMLCSPYVVALGEVGLDRTVPVKLWRRQEEAFRQVLTIIRKDKVLVLHLRGRSSDRFGMDVHSRCIHILQRMCDPD